MNIFFRELKAHRKSLIIWGVCIIIGVYMGMVKFESYQSAGQSMTDLLKDIPNSLKMLLGFGSLDVSKIGGYYGVLYVYLQLTATIHAVMLGAGIISGEESDKTAEFLMTKPVSRSGVVTSKLLAALVNVVVVNICTLVSSVAIVGVYSSGESISGEIAELMLGMFLSQLIFLSVGTGLAAVLKNSKAAASFGAGILVLTYILAMIAGLNSRLEFVKYISPFKYFEAEAVILGNGYEAVYIIFSLIIVVVLSVLTYVFYNRRDLKV